MRPCVFVILAVVFACARCATDRTVATIEQQNLSLNELKHIINEVLPLGVQSISPNGREYVSQRFILRDGQFIEPKESKVRYFAKISVLNTTRPYDIQITVHREVQQNRRTFGKFYVTGRDERMANIIKIILKNRIAKRRGDMNVIDDFKVF